MSSDENAISEELTSAEYFMLQTLRAGDEEFEEVCAVVHRSSISNGLTEVQASMLVFLMEQVRDQMTFAHRVTIARQNYLKEPL